jgi:ribonuclease BN (tRNA processing enzyme)
MRVKILGTRGEIGSTAPWHSRHSGVLVNGRVMFDLGEEEFLALKPEAVFITHLHPDHAYFVRGYGRRQVVAVSPPVYAPEPFERMPDIIVVNGPTRTGGLSVTPIPTHHGKYIKSYAYVIEEGEGAARKRLLYTGDVIWINKEHWPALEGLDLVITEGSFIRKGGVVRRDSRTGILYGHNGVPDLVALFGRFTRRIVLMHFGEWFYEDIKAARKQLAALGNGVKVKAARDGMEVTL